jgi:DNA-directed RNA polymerase subunit RPC12/RpoP
MARCTYCGSTVLFGGVKDEDARFCNAECQEGGRLMAAAADVPEGVLAARVAEVVEDDCPRCGGPGPVDVFTSHRVLSAIVFTSWKNVPEISCRGCATKRQLGGVLTSLLLGWWGFPWGLVMTPVQIVRNLAGLTRNADPEHPSKHLTEMVRIHLATEALPAKGGERDEAAAA